MPIENIDAFRNAVRRNQDFSNSDKVFVGQEGDAPQVQVKAESFGHRIVRHIHQSDDEKRANRQAREIFWEAVSSVYSRRNLAIPEHILRALAEDGIPMEGDKFLNVNKPLSARVVQKVLASIDLDLNLIAVAQKEVSALRASVDQQKTALKSQFQPIVGMFPGKPVTVEDYPRLCGTGVINAMRERWLVEKEKYSKLLSEGDLQYKSVCDECQRQLDKLDQFEQAGMAYEAELRRIYEPLLKATCEYQGLLHAYNNAIFSEHAKANVKPFSSDPLITHSVLSSKPGMNLSSTAWHDTLRRDAPAAQVNQLEVGARAAYIYTMDSNHINAPLSGFNGNSYASPFVGVGKTSWDVTISDANKTISIPDRAELGSARGHISELTEELDKHSSDQDFILYRGTSEKQLAAMVGCSVEDLRRISSEEECAAMTLKAGYFPAFTSTSHYEKGCNQFLPKDGTGVKMRVFCPKGTKMLYCQPFSYFTPSTEYECLLQRGAHFRVSRFAKVAQRNEFSGEVQSFYEVDIEIHPERGYVMTEECLVPVASGPADKAMQAEAPIPGASSSSSSSSHE